MCCVVDVTAAGEGQLEIMVNRGAVPNTVRMLRKGVFIVSFVPRDARTHNIDVKFNGETLARKFCQTDIKVFLCKVIKITHMTKLYSKHRMRMV